MHCELSGMSVCTSAEYEEGTANEIRSICSIEMHYNNCPSQKAAHPACEWEEMFPVCENRIDLASPVIKARAYYNGSGNKKRIGGLVVRLQDESVQTLGVP